MQDDVFETEIRDLSRAGQGVGRLPDGRTCFVPLTAPGDRVRARVIRQEKSYAFGELVEILAASPIRVDPRCSVFGKCGGCEWQHLPYDTQWNTKTQGVAHALRRVGLTPPASGDSFPAPSPFEYRNRIQIRGRSGEVGFYGRGSRTLIPITSCPIARPEINSALPLAREACAGQSEEAKIEIDLGPDGSARMVLNQRHAALGFRQVNDDQNSNLREWVTKRIPQGHRILDLFGGDGNLSRDLQPQARHIDVVDLGRPGPAFPNVTYHRSAVLPWLLKAAKSGRLEGPASAIIDPPREGIRKEAREILESLEGVGVSHLVLVGCEPDSWASTLALALKMGWTFQNYAVFDFFPQTHHVETAASLTR